MRLVDGQGRLFGRINLIDGAAAFFALFSLALVVYFAYNNFLRHTTLTLEDATPKVFVPGVDQFLQIRGNAFKGNLEVKIDGRPPVSVCGVNEARVDVQPPDDLDPGEHQVMVRNPGGRMVIKDAIFQIRWEPVIQQIVLERWGETNQAVYRISGKYLQRGCEVKVNGEPAIGTLYESPNQVLVTVPTLTNDAAVWKELSIQNPSGGGIVLRGDDLGTLMDPDRFILAIKPQVVQIVPERVKVWQDSGIVLLGQDLSRRCTVRIGGKPLEKLEWYPPHVVMGSFPAYSLPPGQYPVEVVNPNGMTTSSSLLFVDEWVADVELFFPELTGQELKDWAGAPGSSVQLLKILSQNSEGKKVRAQVRVPVEIRGIGRDGTTPLCYFGNHLLQVAEEFYCSFPGDRSGFAQVKSAPKLAPRTAHREGS